MEDFARRTICGGSHATLGAEPSCGTRNRVGILSICSEHKMNRMEMCFAWHQMSNIYLCKRMSLYSSVCEYTPVTIPYFMSFTNEHPVESSWNAHSLRCPPISPKFNRSGFRGHERSKFHFWAKSFFDDQFLCSKQNKNVDTIVFALTRSVGPYATWHWCVKVKFWPQVKVMWSGRSCCK